MNIILKDINIIKPLDHIQVRLILFKPWLELNPNTIRVLKIFAQAYLNIGLGSSWVGSICPSCNPIFLRLNCKKGSLQNVSSLTFVK